MMRPFIFVNIASSADGKISDESRKQLKISCEEDFHRVDRLRAFSDAIMVGIGTVLSDDPSLTIKNPTLRFERFEKGIPPNPVRVVVDSKLRTPSDAKVLDGSADTIIAVSEKASRDRIEVFSKKAQILVAGEERVDLKKLCNHLYGMGLRRVMVEGGGTLISSLLRGGLVDEINIYYGDMIVGGKNSPTPVDGKSFSPPIKLELVSVQRLGDGIFARWRVKYI
jgi:2,5-diamino-6-(ribosylamino)-4(3H)-pyrimidinone 5'-phosphate reductase